VNNNNSLEWRRSKVLELASQGYNQSEISRILQISQPTINRDISYMRQQSKEKIKKYVDERLPEEYEKCLVGVTSILKEAWNTATTTEDKREKIQALTLAKECYSMKLDLLTNATVVDDAIRFVSSSKQKEEGQQRQQISSEEEKEEKDKANDLVIENQDNSSDDIQGSEEEDKQQQQQYTRDTTNQTF
jgi:predicted transcriptional regulator